MNQLFRFYWQLSLLKENPGNNPYSPFLMGLSAILLGLVMMIQWSFSDFENSYDLLNTAMTSVTLISSYMAYTYALLFLRGLSYRWVQTLNCLFCTHIIVHVLASPLIMLAPYLAQANLKSPILLFIGVLYLFLTLGLSIWQFVITAHIYKSALNTTSIQSVLAAFGLIAVNILTVSFWR